MPEAVELLDNGVLYMFHYLSGERVLPGDRVISSNGKRGAVQLVILPDTDAARDYSCPRGGVLIVEVWNGHESLLLEDELGLEDVQFVQRGTHSTT